MEVPFHIEEIAKLYPIIASTENNLADGRIDNWREMMSSSHDLPRPGQYLKLVTFIYFDFKNHSYNEMWVHLGNSFFKQVYKKRAE